jgi:hypothetical protein
VDTEGHSKYWDKNGDHPSDSLKNQALVVVGRYDDVGLVHGDAPQQEWVA